MLNQGDNMTDKTEPRMETTKRFPRSMAEAFPKHYPDQFYMLQGYKPRKMHPDLPVVIMCVFAAGFVVGLILGAGK
jgi:hypothetical protein